MTLGAFELYLYHQRVLSTITSTCTISEHLLFHISNKFCTAHRIQTFLFTSYTQINPYSTYRFSVLLLLASWAIENCETILEKTDLPNPSIEVSTSTRMYICASLCVYVCVIFVDWRTNWTLISPLYYHSISLFILSPHYHPHSPSPPSHAITCQFPSLQP